MAVKKTKKGASLKRWFKEEWTDVRTGKPCGRSKGSKRAYPKCVPIAKARSMSSSQKKSAVSRKRAAGNPGGKPTNVKTIVKKSKGGYITVNPRGFGRMLPDKRPTTRIFT